MTANGKTAGELFAMIRKTMPSEDPGSLRTRESSDIVALIFSANDSPSRAKELGREVDSLNQVRIEAFQDRNGGNNSMRKQNRPFCSDRERGILRCQR